MGIVAAGDGAQAFATFAEKLGAKVKVLPGEARRCRVLEALAQCLHDRLGALTPKPWLPQKCKTCATFYDIIPDIDEARLQQFLEA